MNRDSIPELKARLEQHWIETFVRLKGWDSIVQDVTSLGRVERMQVKWSAKWREEVLEEAVASQDSLFSIHVFLQPSSVHVVCPEVEQARSISFVKPKDALAVQTLDALTVGLVDRCSIGLI